jgi:hypothetical protein
MAVLDREDLGEAVTYQEWCVQYRCPPNMLDWHEFAGTRRHAQKWAQLELENCRFVEFDPAVEYRLAVRTVTEWEEAS